MEVTSFIKTTMAAALIACGHAALAQDGPLRGTVNVDGKYLPDVIRQDRLNTLPRLYSFPLTSTPLEYAFRGVVTPYNPEFSALPVTGWRVDRNVRHYRGYLDINAGSWLNSSVSAGYRPIFDDEKSLAVWLQHNSSSLFKPKMADYADNIRREKYDEVIGADYSHTIADAGRLDAKVAYHLGYFNYYGFYAPGDREEDPRKAPTQTLNDITGRVGWSALPDAPLQYDAALDVRYFGMRRLYAPVPEIMVMSGGGTQEIKAPGVKGGRETHIRLGGGLSYAFSQSSTLGFRLHGDWLGYAPVAEHLSPIDDYGDVSLTPYYRLRKGNLDVNLGVNLDFTFNAGPKGDRFDTFHASPDVRLDFRSGIAGLYLHVGGGTRLNTLASLCTSDYYGLPTLVATTPSYVPVDAELGINFGPMSGITAGVSFAYKYVNHQPFGGLYTAYLNRTLDGRMPQGVVAEPLSPDGMKVQGWSIGANIGLDLGKYVSLAFDGSYQPQKGDKGYYNGLDRPRWLLSASAKVTPIEPLGITLQYNYRGVRNVYTAARYESAIGDGAIAGGDAYDAGVQAIRLPDVTDLALRVSYNITPAISVSVQADNLLNNKIEILPDVKTSGVNILGGVQFTF